MQTGEVVIPVVFHVIFMSKNGDEEGNVPESMINAQMDVLNEGFDGTGFSFTLNQIIRHSSNKYYQDCYMLWIQRII